MILLRFRVIMRDNGEKEEISPRGEKYINLPRHRINEERIKLVCGTPEYRAFCALYILRAWLSNNAQPPYLLKKVKERNGENLLIVYRRPTRLSS